MKRREPLFRLILALMSLALLCGGGQQVNANELFSLNGSGDQLLKPIGYDEYSYQRCGVCRSLSTIPYSQEEWNRAATADAISSRCCSARRGALYATGIATEVFGCPGASIGRVLDTGLFIMACCNKKACCRISSCCGIPGTPHSAHIHNCSASPCTSTLSVLTGVLPGVIVGAPLGALYGALVYTKMR